MFGCRIKAMPSYLFEVPNSEWCPCERLAPILVAPLSIISRLQNELESLACRSPIFAPNLTYKTVR